MPWAWLKRVSPSSIQAYRRSSEPTCIGNHMCPNSWTITDWRDSVSRGPPMQVNIGYSMPVHDTGPSIAVICGYGYDQRYSERNSTACRAYNDERNQAGKTTSGR